MPNLVQSLNNLDFGVYIGGPLQAAIEAQQQASITTVDFIKEVGFNANDELNMVSFSFKKKEPDSSATGFVENIYKLDVPFLTMLQVPSLRIDEVNINFNARLTSVETSNISSDFSTSASVSGKFWRVRFKASASYQRKTSRSEKIEKTYHLGVNVKAVQDAIPEGLDRLLSILEESIQQQQQ